MICTIFKNIFSKDPHYIKIDDAIERIKSGKSKRLVEEIRKCLDKEKAQNLKKNLPSVCFSGEFGSDRTDASLKKHSGFIVLDFDNVENLSDKTTEIISNDFVYACWVSPSGNGVKALIRIANGDKHREHFNALKEIFPDADDSGVNPSRVCYESYDPNIYVYPDSTIFSTIKTTEYFYVKSGNSDSNAVFQKITKWLTNRNDAFVTGERNNFIFKLSSACCRFGIDEESAKWLIHSEYLNGSNFSMTECDRTIHSGYKANNARFGTCTFDKDILVEKSTRKEIEIDSAMFDLAIKPKDVIYGVDVKEEAIKIFKNGYAQLRGINVMSLDFHFKPKKGEITLITGMGNAGKSTLKKWYQLNRSLLYGEKFATFSPEECPPEEYYHDFVEMLLGCDCTPSNPRQPSIETYERAYDWVSKHVFYVYPKSISPTPDYIKERFLELVIKEKIDGVDIDPFNQLANDYSRNGLRTDKYLETFLSDCSRFAQINNIYFWIIAHPKNLVKSGNGNYPCPDVFDIADGAMWNNKMDNILVYHRPLGQTDPQNPTCEFHSKKIRRQKMVGKRGFTMFDWDFKSRRFMFDGFDSISKAINDKKLDFQYKQQEISYVNEKGWQPFKDGENETELPF